MLSMLDILEANKGVHTSVVVKPDRIEIRQKKEINWNFSQMS